MGSYSLKIFHSPIQDLQRQVQMGEIEIAPVSTTLAGVGRFDQLQARGGPKKPSRILGDSLADSQMAGIVVRNAMTWFVLEPTARALLLEISVKAKVFDQISHGILVLSGHPKGSLSPNRVIFKKVFKVLQVGAARSAHGEHGVQLQGTKGLYGASG
jgi:hypothetical protein